MSGNEAFAVLRRELGRRSQSEIAKELGVSTATLSRWARLTSPPGGANLSRLVLWAESLPRQASVDVLAAAVESTGENLVRLAEIRGYAKSVLAMLRAVADEQQRVVDTLEPWTMAEGRALAAKVPAQDRDAIRNSVRQSEQKTTRRRPKEA
jgi:transcriptional regulator with XRE-family HTH domain